MAGEFYFKENPMPTQNTSHLGPMFQLHIANFFHIILSRLLRADCCISLLVDFKKAFNRQSHEILVTKLSDLGVPGWLLKLVIAFIKDRRMVVKLDGKCSTQKYLPCGGPRGTILALILFLVLINDQGFDDQTNDVGKVITSTKRTSIDR